MFPEKRATRATKHMNPLPSTGFMRSTKRATFFSDSGFSDADNIYHHIIFCM